VNLSDKLAALEAKERQAATPAKKELVETARRRVRTTPATGTKHADGHAGPPSGLVRRNGSQSISQCWQ